MKKVLLVALCLALILGVFAGCVQQATPEIATLKTVEPQATKSQANSPLVADLQTIATIEPQESSTIIEENGRYSSKDEVALYLNTYEKLPSNYITKKEAEKLGWNNKKGNLWEVTDNMSIGGDHFSNREGSLPTAKGRKYFECDIDYDGAYRGAKRIIYSSDGLIYYTDDHYETFTQLY